MSTLVNPYSDLLDARPVPGVARVRDALILTGRGVSVPCVREPSGAPVIEGLLHRRGAFLEPGPEPERPRGKVERLQGRWLFGGDYWSHFGHFLFESLARLWALEFLNEPLDGIVFVQPTGRKVREGVTDRFDEMLLKRMGIDLPIRVVEASTEVEELLIPQQGCGMGVLASGTPVFRDFIRRRLTQGLAPGPHKKLYLSRAAYGLRRGGVFAEFYIERLLKAEGYHIYCPEQDTIEQQIAAYMGASHVIGPDGSALHMVGFVGQPDQDVAILLRRKAGHINIFPQLAGFMGRPPLVVNRMNGYLMHEGRKNLIWSSFADLDFPAVGQDLADNGFIENPDAWRPMSDNRRGKVIGRYEARVKAPLNFVPIEESAF
ncbi:glycosyltransferase family 61 protein [Pseudoprimorskyibacter insulae]|uniref:Glycosyltransferase 61 catalytic domain-containing protein n=1 Tax=Pseudoprimorskyibacter insulae TaxID=1695997 RepID=A0A2R8AP37_9RHOB|nr:glycosyltransferase 61 family protein [Pseudoprimorskyibacter insulae]SPF77740.1 hypothetical protein PRI8871_00325 [Pseudoprimorskyibacter insulae]